MFKALAFRARIVAHYVKLLVAMRVYAPVMIQLRVFVLRKAAEDNPDAWAAVTKVGNLGEVAGCQLQYNFASVVAVMYSRWKVLLFP